MRKGARRIQNIDAPTLALLSSGQLACATLTECLAVDQSVLLRAVWPVIPDAVFAQAQQCQQAGISQRMRGMAALLLAHQGAQRIVEYAAHPADLVRGWACFMIGAQPDLSLAQRLEAIRPLADDAHFGVREWAWMAVRPYLAQDLTQAIALLLSWTDEPSAYLRRFACESIRPRGVWCAHIHALRQQPTQALPILQALNADSTVYVQDSVANWLNDAAKDQADWVRQVCADWQQMDSVPESTLRICRRALRSIDKPH